MQQERIFEGFITSAFSKAYDTRKGALTAFTGQASRGINMSEFIPLMAGVDLPKGSIVKIVPFEPADIEAQNEDGFKAVLVSSSSDIGSCAVSMAELKQGQFGLFQTKGFFGEILFSENATDGQQIYVKADGTAVVTEANGLVPLFGLFTVGATTITAPATTALGKAVSPLALSCGLASGGGSGVTVDWDDVENKPTVIAAGADEAAARDAIDAAALGSTPGAALAASASAGVATDAARSDHVHPFPSQLQTARTIALTGPVTGSQTFDGSANASIATTLAAATTSALGGVLQMPASIDSVATDVPTLVGDFNALLAKLRTAGIMAT